MELTKSMQLTKKERKRNVWLTILIGLIIVIASQALAMIPSSFLNNGGAKEVYILFSNGFVILALLVFIHFFEKRSLYSVGLKKNNFFISLLKGGGFGFLLIFSVFLINLFTGSISTSINLGSLSWIYFITAFLGYFFQGTMEELVCRGFIMNSLSARYNVWIGILVNTLIFAGLHGFSDNVTLLAMFNLVLAGLLLSFIFYLTDNILLVGAFHAIWNFTLGPVFGVPVSGIGFYSSLFKTESISNQSIINGGLFGFEGGLALTVSALIGLVLVFTLLKKKRTL